MISPNPWQATEKIPEPVALTWVTATLLRLYDQARGEGRTRDDAIRLMHACSGLSREKLSRLIAEAVQRGQLARWRVGWNSAALNPVIGWQAQIDAARGRTEDTAVLWKRYYKPWERNGDCGYRVTCELIARDLGCTTRSAQRHVARAREAGLL
jgi:hypothetical protein